MAAIASLAFHVFVGFGLFFFLVLGFVGLFVCLFGGGC